MKTKVVVILGFVIAFAAGTVVGMLLRQEPVIASSAGEATGRRPPESWLAERLGLDARQTEQVKQIWSDAMQAARRDGDRDRWHQLRQKRDQAVADLIRPEDKAAYERVLQTYEDETAKLGRERHQAFQAAVAKTREILTPEQRAKYEQLLKDRPHGPPGRGGPGRGRRQERGHEQGNDRRPGDRATAPSASE